MRYPQFWRLPEEVIEMIFEKLRIDEAASRIGASMRGLLARLQMQGLVWQRRVCPVRGGMPRLMPVLLRSVSARRARVDSALWRYRDPVEWELMGE